MGTRKVVALSPERVQKVDESTRAYSFFFSSNNIMQCFRNDRFLVFLDLCQTTS